MSRNYVFTLNNPTEIEKVLLGHIVCTGDVQAGSTELEHHELCEELEDSQRVPCKYLVCQEEIGEQGTVHIQGYLECSRTIRATGDRGLKCFPALFRAHLESRRGTQAQAIAYSQKEETRREQGFRLEVGEKAVRGARTDLEMVRVEIRNGATELQIADGHFSTWVRNYRALDRYRLLYRQSIRTPRPVPRLEIHWGVSGAGKSQGIFDRFPGAYWLTKPEGGVVYYDGVTEDTRVLVYDDFYSWVKHATLLRICDKFPLQLKVHGGFVSAPNLSHVIFTSNQDPRHWYTRWANYGGWEFSAFHRRLTDNGEIIHYPNRWDWMAGGTNSINL